MKFFKKLKTGFKRKFTGNKICLITEEKEFGNIAELSITTLIKKAIPNALIKTNIILNTSSGFGEIDCLILIDNRLFILEIKHWLGTIVEHDDYFISYKLDKYTNEYHKKELKSPFNQIKRQIKLLKEKTNSNPWINPIVFFVDADKIECESDNIWFDNFDDLILYLKNDGYSSYNNQINNCWNNIKSSDYIYSSSFLGKRNLICIIDDNSLKFNTDKGFITKKNINFIYIKHHFSFDELFIHLKNGEIAYTTNETCNIVVNYKNTLSSYSLAKIDGINIGD